MEKSSKRGKIPESAWPLIMARYEAGETLSSIARTYDCSPPAISYVVSRSRARQAGGETPRPAAAGEPQLIKNAAGNGARGAASRAGRRSPVRNSSGQRQRVCPSRPRPHRWRPRAAGRKPVRAERAVTGASSGRSAALAGACIVRFGAPGAGELRSARPAPRPADPQPSQAPASYGSAPQGPANSDPRGRLHLSLGNGAPANGGSQPSEPRLAEGSQPPMPQHTPQHGGERPAWPAPIPHHYPGPAEQHRHAMPPAGAPMRVN